MQYSTIIVGSIRMGTRPKVGSMVTATIDKLNIFTTDMQIKFFPNFLDIGTREDLKEEKSFFPLFFAASGSH